MSTNVIQPQSNNNEKFINGFFDNVGKSPLIKLKTLSKLTGCSIMAKVEYMNLGSSIKDRAATYILKDALEKGELEGKDVIFEATAGNTGIALCLIANSLGKKTYFCCPEYVSREKIEYLETLGAKVQLCPIVPVTDERHFMNVAPRLAKEQNGFFANQMNNLNNFKAHYETTGPEIWEQTSQKIDIFTCASGTGGTIGGVSTFLREKNPQVQIISALNQSQYTVPNKDNGEGLFEWREMSEEEKNNRKFTSSAMEGTGSVKLFQNLCKSRINDSFVIPDTAAINMSHFVLKHEGLFVGSSSGLNLVSSVLSALKHGEGKDKIIVTIMCDCGSKYMSKIYSQQWLQSNNIPIVVEGKDARQDFNNIFSKEFLETYGLK